MLKSLSLEIFAKFLKVWVSVSDDLVSKKCLGFGFGENWSWKKVSVSENLVSEKKYRFQFQKKLVSEKSVGFGFGKFGI